LFSAKALNSGTHPAAPFCGKTGQRPQANEFPNSLALRCKLHESVLTDAICRLAGYVGLGYAETMLATLPVLAFIAFGACYPLFFFTQYGQPVRGSFNRFQLGLSCLVGAMGAIPLFFMDAVPLPARLVAVVWLVWLLGVSGLYWRSETVNEWIVAFPSAAGLAALVWAQSELVTPDRVAWLSTVLGSLVLAGAFFAMILGHWYLNVRALSLRHISRATLALGGLLLLRMIWDVMVLTTDRVMFEGYYISLWRFMRHPEGVFLAVAVGLGTLAPLILIVFVMRTLKVRATESATGLLYVIVLLVLMGEFTCRYYLLAHGLTL
jgi:hypothetical protein